MYLFFASCKNECLCVNARRHKSIFTFYQSQGAAIQPLNSFEFYIRAAIQLLTSFTFSTELGSRHTGANNMRILCCLIECYSVCLMDEIKSRVKHIFCFQKYSRFLAAVLLSPAFYSDISLQNFRPIYATFPFTFSFDSLP